MQENGDQNNSEYGQFFKTYISIVRYIESVYPCQHPRAHAHTHSDLLLYLRRFMAMEMLKWVILSVLLF